jgi:hypothetical protein
MGRLTVELLHRHETSRVDAMSGSKFPLYMVGTARGVNDVE